MNVPLSSTGLWAAPAHKHHQYDIKSDIIEGAEEIETDLATMFNKMLEELEVPGQCVKMKIKSVYKNKGERKETKTAEEYSWQNIKATYLKK